MSQVHFAIVLNNYDNHLNNVLTVIPLTSNSSKYNLNLGPLIIDTLVNHVKEELNKLGMEEEFKKLYCNQFDIKNKDIKKSSDKMFKISKLITLLEYYKSNAKIRMHVVVL